MDRLSGLACAGVQGLRRVTQWTQEEASAQRQRLASYGGELRPRKRVRREQVERRDDLTTTALSPQHLPEPTQAPELKARDTLEQAFQPTPSAIAYPRRQIVLDSNLPPSAPSETLLFTGSTVAGSQAVNVPTGSVESAPNTVVTVTASPSASAAASSGMNTTTEAIIIACSIAGALIVVTLIVLLSCCYRKKKRQAKEQQLALSGMPRRMQSSSTMRSDGWRSESSEPEKQSLIYSHARDRSRSVSPSTREPAPNQAFHAQQRSLGNARVFMDTIPESPTQPPSPTSVYTKKSPPQATEAGQLQVTQTNGMGWDDAPLSPLRPPPLRIRQGAESGNNSPMHSTMLPSPKNMFSTVRLPFMSRASSHTRRSSTGQSMAPSYDEERAMAHHRRTMDSETLPAPGAPSGYRDSFWSVAASSIKRNKQFQSGYGDSIYGAGTELRHTRTTSTSSGTNSRIASSGLGLGLAVGGSDEAGLTAMSGRARSHSSFYSGRAPSQALIPALPPMPARFDAEHRQQGHKSGLQNQSVASVGSMIPPGEVELKGRLHSVDFWAREERDMRLGTFAPAELEGSSGHPTPIMEVPTPMTETASPRDSKGMAIGAAIASTRRHSNPYFASAVIGSQGAYSVAVQGGNGPVRESTLMPQGYSHESADDGRRLWNRGRSRDRSTSNGRNSASTVATVFKQHPGDMVMI